MYFQGEQNIPTLICEVILSNKLTAFEIGMALQEIIFPLMMELLPHLMS
jgi:hypothetical protein